MFRGAFEAPDEQPYFINDPDGKSLLFAGLWERWRPAKGAEPILTYTIVTGPPCLVSGNIHDRAPLILPPDLWNDWLLGDVAKAKQIAASTAEPSLTYHPVSKAVGSPRNDTPELVHPIEA